MQICTTPPLPAQSRLTQHHFLRKWTQCSRKQTHCSRKQHMSLRNNHTDRRHRHCVCDKAHVNSRALASQQWAHSSKANHASRAGSSRPTRLQHKLACMRTSPRNVARGTCTTPPWATLLSAAVCILRKVRLKHPGAAQLQVACAAASAFC